MDTNPFGTVIFDIETVAKSFDGLDSSLQEKIAERARSRADKDGVDPDVALEEDKSRLGLNPLYAEVVAVGVLDAESDRGAVYYVTPDSSGREDDEDGIKYVSLDEEGVLERFWGVAQACRRLVGFNSRSFDAPFLNVRSALNGLRPSVDLLSNRYLGMQKRPQHVDLLDQLSFYGATFPRRGTLHEWCLAFGIESPKSDGVAGEDVARLCAEGQQLEVARYNARDIFATRELYRCWDKLLNFQK